MSTVPLDRIAGLDGFIREWWVRGLPPADAAWQPLPLRDDYGLWLRQDPRLAAYQATGFQLRTVLVAAHAQRVTVVLNAFAGYQLLLDGRPIATPARHERYTFDDLRHHLDLVPGAHELIVQARVADLPPVFAARLASVSGLSGIATEAVLRAPGEGGADRQDEVAEPRGDAEAFRYYNARSNAVPCPREGWRSSAAFAAWQDGFRTAFARLMPPPPGASGLPLEAEVIQRVALPDHVRETVRITVEPGWRTDVYLLLPHGPAAGAGPWPGLLCLHGHGRGKDDLVGEDRGDPARRETIDALREDYALRYVRRGYVAAVPGMRLLAGRGLPRRSWKRRDPCDNGYAQATMFGLVPAALDAWDARRTLELLAGRPEVAQDAAGPRLGCAGLSYGGRATMNLAALDERVRVAVVSGAMNCFRERLVSFAGCGSQFVPGLFTIGDTPEVLASLAPRPLLLELGSRDGTSPAIFAEEMHRTLAAAYGAAGHPDRLAVDVFEGEHRFNGQLADAWLDRWLRDANWERLPAA